MSEPEVVFAFTPGQNAFFRDLAEALCLELERLGATSRVAVGEFPAPTDSRVVVLVAPHEFTGFSGVVFSPALLRRCVLISAEQPSSPSLPVSLGLGSQAGAVFDVSQAAVQAYRQAGIAAEHLQLGYSEAWDRRGEVAERDIDVLFLGRVTERRERALAGYADQLERFRCELILADGSLPNAGEGPNFAAKESKLRLLARSKVLLNVHGEEQPYFEWLRAAEAISSGCVVVSEHSTDLGPLRQGVDIVTGSLDSLGYLAAWMADDAERRAEVAREAEGRLRTVSLATVAAGLLDAARRVDAAPAPPRVAAQARVAQARIASVPVLAPENPPPPPEDEVASDVRRALGVLKRQQQELASLRQRLDASDLAQARPEDPLPRTVDDASTPAWRDGSRPVVSVVVPLCDQQGTVGETLDSVNRSSMKAWEIVVVDDASGDEGNAAVREWMEGNADRRVALVRHEVKRGLPAARNTGARRARGELVLMLDSANLLRPFGMERLLRALVEDPGADFAYGILDRFGSPDQVGMVSKFGWDLLRFQRENYIDALALIRRRALFEMNGYSEDPRLGLGLEDYDLWARMAEGGRRAAFVRQFVGSYRAAYSSVHSVAGISSADAIAAIAENAPNLMRGVEIGAL
jgi:Glycosyl transferase family 2